MNPEDRKDAAEMWTTFLTEAAAGIHTVAQEEYFCFSKEKLQGCLEEIIWDVTTPPED